MRSCLRCQNEMKEELILRTADGYELSVSEKGIFKGSLGKIFSAVCPNCGYTELYLKDTEKLKKAIYTKE